MMRLRRRNVPAGGRADESGPDEHGALDRVAGAPARQRGHRLRGHVAGRLQDRDGRRKHILKEVLRPLLPAGILDRRKQGFGVPVGVWFRGGLTDLFSDVLDAPRTRQRGYFEPSFISPPGQGTCRRHTRSHAAPLAAACVRALAPAVSRREPGRVIRWPTASSFLHTEPLSFLSGRRISQLIPPCHPSSRGTSLAEIAVNVRHCGTVQFRPAATG